MKVIIDDKFDYFEIKLGFKEKIVSFHGSFEKVPISKIKRYQMTFLKGHGKI